MSINTTRAFFITIGILFIGFIWTTFFPNAPYETLTPALVVTFGAVAGKRLAQKAKWANGGK